MPGQSSVQGDGASVYMPYGASGGGGAGGQYVFTDLDELDAIISELGALRDEIHRDGTALERAWRLATAPAVDAMSVGQADAYRSALEKAKVHNDAMAAYADDQLEKLKAARSTYLGTDTASASGLRSVGEAG